MNDQDFDEFSTLLDEAARVLYRYELPAAAIVLYWRSLQTLCDIKGFREALTAHITDATISTNGSRRGDFMPKPADLISHIEVGSGRSRDSARAWLSVEMAIRRVGKNRSVTFNDPSIHLTIVALGGWIRLCETLKEDDYSLRKSFGDIYREVYNTKELAPSYLIGVEDSHNLKISDDYQVKAFSIGNNNNTTIKLIGRN